MDETKFFCTAWQHSHNSASGPFHPVSGAMELHEPSPSLRRIISFDRCCVNEWLLGTYEAVKEWRSISFKGIFKQEVIIRREDSDWMITYSGSCPNSKIIIGSMDCRKINTYCVGNLCNNVTFKFVDLIAIQSVDILLANYQSEPSNVAQDLLDIRLAL